MKKAVKLLKNIHTLKSEIALLRSKIGYYESLLKLPSLNQFSFQKNNKNGIRYISPINSPVEQEAIRNITKSVLNYEIVKELLQECRSQLLIKENELNEIEIAMQALNKEERYIISCKYDCNMQWRHITINFNSKFRKGYSISEDAVMKKYKLAINKIDDLLHNHVFEVAAVGIF